MEDCYISKEPCPDCGFVSFRGKETGKCFNCLNRDDARKRGDDTYRPGVLCPHCGTYSKVRVADHVCTTCFPLVRRDHRGQRIEPMWKRILNKETKIMMEAEPDMIVDREDAWTLGLQVFRTGQPCRKGHISFWLVETMYCLDCLKEED